MVRYNRLGYVALNVTDPARSHEFYETQLGLQSSGETGDGALALRCSSAHHDFLLYEADEPGLKRIGWELEDEEQLESFYEDLVKRDLEVREVDAQECKDLCQGPSFRLREPNSGVTMEYYATMREFGGLPFQPSVAKIQRIGHVVLHVAAYDEMVKFCRDVLGFRVSDSIDGLVTFMRCHPNPYHHTFAIGKSERNGLHHVNLMVSEVDDIGRAMVRFNKQQIPIVHGPGRHPPSGSMFLYFLDPDGMTLEYSFGMEEFPEEKPRKPRLLEPVRSSFDYWEAPVDPRKSKVGAIEGGVETPAMREAS